MINEDRIESVKIQNPAENFDHDDAITNGTSLAGYVNASFNEIVDKLGRTILIDEWESDGKVFNEWVLLVEVEEQLEKVFYKNPDFDLDTDESQRFLSCHEDDVPLATNFWHDTVEHEFVITIYDWKEEHNMVARDHGGDAIYTWHIGCDPKYANIAEQIVKDMLSENPMDNGYIEII
tara:strand:+ start:1276 stop:1809 length:534 start_codon:yes stop_codon:yes gene_type:complete